MQNEPSFNPLSIEANHAEQKLATYHRTIALVNARFCQLEDALLDPKKVGFYTFPLFASQIYLV